MRTEDTIPGSEVMVDGYKALAAAVVLQASKQARGGDRDAASWLASDTGMLFCEGIGLDQRRVNVLARNWKNARYKPDRVTWRVSLLEWVPSKG